jgi:hypothetical protein
VGTALTRLCPPYVSFGKIPEFKFCAARIEPLPQREAAE